MDLSITCSSTIILTVERRALSGFLLSLTPLSCTLMGWRGAGGNGAANVGTFFAFGGVLMLIGSVGEVSKRQQLFSHRDTSLSLFNC